VNEGGFMAAWLVGMGIVTWKEVRATGHMPVPGNMAGVTALFAVLGLMADAIPSAARTATLLAWGLDIAGLFNILPAGLFGQVQQAQAAEQQATGTS
jgi:hypothetical protein